MLNSDLLLSFFAFGIYLPLAANSAKISAYIFRQTNIMLGVERNDSPGLTRDIYATISVNYYHGASEKGKIALR